MEKILVIMEKIVVKMEKVEKMEKILAILEKIIVTIHNLSDQGQLSKKSFTTVCPWCICRQMTNCHPKLGS